MLPKVRKDLVVLPPGEINCGSQSGIWTWKSFPEKSHPWAVPFAGDAGLTVNNFRLFVLAGADF
jgi:hypothetical protein